MRTSRSRLLLLLTCLLLVFAACGNDDDTDNDAADSADDAADTADDDAAAAEVTVASFAFGESEILANIYGLALADAGVDVDYKLKLGPREIVAPALEKGEIDIVPEYLGNLLSFLDADASKPGDDVDATTGKLRTAAGAKKLTVLEPSEATDGDVIVMTKAKATELGVTKISDLKGKEAALVMGGPPECQTRITCLTGLQDVYGLEFKEFKALDTGGPLTVGALKDGSIQLARLFSSDPAIKANDFVELEDDKFIQPAGNVVPVVRDDALTDTIEEALDKVSAALTTEDLIEMNTRVDVDKEDAKTVAEEWVKENL